MGALPDLITQVSPGQLDENGLECGFTYGNIFQVVAGDADEFGQKATAAIGEDDEPGLGALHTLNAGQRSHALAKTICVRVLQLHLEDLLRADAVLQLFRSAADKNLAVIDDRHAS